MRRALPRRLLAVLGLLLLVAAAASCSNDSITDPNAPMNLKLHLAVPADTLYVSDTVAAGQRVQLGLSGTSRGLPVSTPLVAEWTSSNTAVATVDETGLVTPVGIGSAKITARVNDERVSTTIVVARAAVHVEVSPSTISGLAGDTVTVTARALDAQGALVPGTAYAFGVSDPTLATVTRIDNRTARVVFLKAGTVQVTVDAAGQQAVAVVTIDPREFVGDVVRGPVLGGGSLTLSAGQNTTCGLLRGGRAECFGTAPLIGIARDTSCFDDRETQDTIRDPVRLPCTLVPLRIAGALALKQVSVGDSVACGVTTDNRAYCWGNQLYGQLGNGVASQGSAAEPSLVTGSVTRAAVNLTQVSAGGNHACGLTPAGKADCWGQDSLLQLGDDRVVNSTTPIPVNDAFTFVAISAGRNHTCALQADGVAFCWGDNRFGQLGRGAVGGGTTVAGALPLVGAADAVAGGALRFKQISAGARHTCGVTTGNAVYCWGSNADGELGSGAVGGSSGTPAAVAGGGSYTAIDAGRAYACALSTSGAAFCWGRNTYGQVGNGSGNGLSGGPPVATPTAVVGGHTFSAITAGDRHVCAIATDAEAPGAYCWGSNVLGSLGNGLQAAVRSTPQKTATPE